MKIQSQATRVLERTSHYLKSGLLKDKPVWYDVVSNNPPQLDMTKKPKTIQNKQYQDPVEAQKTAVNGLFKTRLSDSERKKPNKLVHRVPKLEFFEDELRDLFYKQHPWEFSRPKTLIENEGNDNSQCDWSHMLQLHKPLDGESVVQRTLWILKNEKRDLFDAYDKARFEFYRVRMQEEMSSLVSREESSMYGSVIPTTNLEFGVQQEQEYVDIWAKVASDKTKVKNASATSKALGASVDDGQETTKSSIFESDFDVEVEDDQKTKD